MRYFPILMIAAFIGYYVFVQSKQKKAMALMPAAFREFLMRSGYRYPDMPPEPVETHIQRAVAEMNAPHQAGDKVIQYVRHFHGMPILWKQEYHRLENGASASASWSTALRQPPRVPFHIADRTLSSMGKAVREAFSNTTRNWSPRFPQPVQTGIPQIDSRFVVYGFDPNAVAGMFHQNPALVSVLLQCVEVDFWIDQHACVFADPLQKNLSAAQGGMVGMMATGMDIGKRMEMSLPVHERMSELIALTVRATQ